MGNWETPRASEYPVCLLSPCCPGLFAEAGEKPVCRGQRFVSREGFQAFTGTVCRRAERGGLRSLRRGDHPKGTPVQAACQPSCLLLCYGEFLPKSSPGAGEDIMVTVPCSWKRCQEGFHLVLSTPCSNTGDDDTPKSLVSPHDHTVVLQDQRKDVKERGSGLGYWQCSSGPCWWGVSTIQCLPVLTEHFTGILFEYCSGGSCLLKWGTGRQREGFGSWRNFQYTHRKWFWNTQALKGCMPPFS